MKKLGLIGGMGPESTIPYYHDIVYGVQKELGNNTYPELTIESVNVFHVLQLCKEEKYDELTDYLIHAIYCLKNSGADFAALTANTPHIVFDRLVQASPLPLVSIVDSACEEAIKCGYQRIGLLGTIFTMKNDFFKDPFIKNQIDIISPQGTELELVNEKIVNELELGIVTSETLQIFQRIINDMIEKSDIQAIVLGCTELPLLLNDEVTPVPCLDTMQIHIKKLIQMILE